MNDNLAQTILKCGKEQIVLYFDSNPNMIDDLILLVFAKDAKIAWRSTWALDHCNYNKNEKLSPYLDSFIELLPKADETMQRVMLRLITPLNLQEESFGKLLNVCLAIWEDIRIKSAVRLYAFKIILKAIEMYPELRNEFQYLFDNHYMENISPGIKHSINKLMNTAKNSRRIDR